MNNPICFALDLPNLESAQKYVDMLEGHVGAFKVGLELFTAEGQLPKTNTPIVLDLKLHDIPETVERATKAAALRGVRYLTLHVQQRAALEKAQAVAAKYAMKLLGVTVLTSMDQQDLEDLRLEGHTQPSRRVKHLAEFAASCGLTGFVCSPEEVQALRKAIPGGFFLVPGIRPAGSQTGDQKRVGTPKQAIADGANLLVIGRPIRDASDPVAAAQSILAEIETVPIV